MYLLRPGKLSRDAAKMAEIFIFSREIGSFRRKTFGFTRIKLTRRWLRHTLHSPSLSCIILQIACTIPSNSLHNPSISHCPIPCPFLLSLQHFPRNHQPLNLAGPLPDRAQLHVAIKLLRRIVLDEAIPAMQLHPFLANPHRDLTRIQLRH